jgi:hypothetical protein
MEPDHCVIYKQILEAKGYQGTIEQSKLYSYPNLTIAYE